MIYALLLPRTIPVSNRTATGLGRGAMNTFEGAYSKKAKKKPGHSAFAINALWNWGYSTQQKTQLDADETAIAYCERGAARSIAKLNPTFRRYIKAKGWQNCRVVDRRVLN